MHSKSNACTDRTARLAPSSPWRLSEVYPLESHRLYVTFKDGLEGSVDLSKLVTSAEAGVFIKLRDPEFFQSVYLHNGAVTWPGGLDLAPDAMYDAIKAHGTWMVDAPC